MALRVDDHREVVVVDPVAAHHVVVDDDRAVLTDRAHRELAMPRHTQLANEDHVDGCPECPGDRHRHRHTAARETDHDHGLGMVVERERIADRDPEPLACVDPIVEHDHIVPRRAAVR